MRMITGRTGEKHVRAKDDARITRLLIGNGDYILPDGNQLTMQKDTTQNYRVKVFDGYLAMQGRQAGIDPSDPFEYLTLSTSGLSAGVNRIDVVYAEYLNTNGIESVTLKVLTGTGTTGVPVEPSLVYDDSDIDINTIHQMALYRVIFDGTSTGGVYNWSLERIAQVLDNSSFSSLIESVADVTDDINNRMAAIVEYINGMESRVQQHWQLEADKFINYAPISGNIYAQCYFCHLSSIVNPQDYYFDDDGYEYENGDVFSAYVNGLRCNTKLVLNSSADLDVLFANSKVGDVIINYDTTNEWAIFNLKGDGDGGLGNNGDTVILEIWR